MDSGDGAVVVMGSIRELRDAKVLLALLCVVCLVDRRERGQDVKEGDDILFSSERTAIYLAKNKKTVFVVVEKPSLLPPRPSEISVGKIHMACSQVHRFVTRLADLL